MAGGGLNGQLLRERDWTKTPLGPVTSWNQTLLSMFSLVMSSIGPVALFWGKDPVLLYNDSYVGVIGHHHPAALGAPARACWAELFPTLDSMIDDVFRGESVYVEDGTVIAYRYGFAEVPFCRF